MTLTPLTRPGIDVRTFPNRTNLNTSRASLGSERYQGSSHMRGSISQAIQTCPRRARAETTAETAIPLPWITEPPFGSTGSSDLRAELAGVGADRAPDRVGLVELLDFRCIFQRAAVPLVEDDHEVVLVGGFVGLLFRRRHIVSLVPGGLYRY